MIDYYCVYPIAPVAAIVLIHNNDAAVGVPSIGDATVFNNDIAMAFMRVRDKAGSHNTT
ncbi:unnamed protein product, partial [marine sediment metagenome]